MASIGLQYFEDLRCYLNLEIKQGPILFLLVEQILFLFKWNFKFIKNFRLLNYSQFKQVYFKIGNFCRDPKSDNLKGPILPCSYLKPQRIAELYIYYKLKKKEFTSGKYLCLVSKQNVKSSVSYFPSFHFRAKR